ncbi:MAG: serine hydrolase domain-containing protein [Candidatus Hodarchaeales archaeon]|jgi:CubicO group peptidase (beta-lactamase class C family)
MKNSLFQKGFLVGEKHHKSKIIVFLSIMLLNLPLSPILSLDYFPTNGWRVSTPEAQGIDSTNLDKMYPTIIKNDVGIDSILIIKNGYLVYEKYFDYYNYTNIHHMFSVTKTISGILAGIANTTGFITNLDQPVLEIFANRTFANVDARKQALTIRHLLKMQSGIQWNSEIVPYFSGQVDKHDYDLLSNHTDDISNWPLSWPFNPGVNWHQMILSSDWVQFVLDQPMVAYPGTSFYYSSGDSHLLSAIIQKKTGMNTEDFARQYLFDPLNITEYVWWKDSMGKTMGAFGLWLQPIDMAKIGYLYLNNGTWNGTPIVPKEWIEISTVGDNVTKEYGYQWRIKPSEDYYYAQGLGGQYILVMPDKSLVIVITASEFNQEFGPMNIVLGFVLNSLITDELTITDEPTTTSSTVNRNTPFQPSLFGVLILILLTVHYRKDKQKKR